MIPIIKATNTVIILPRFGSVSNFFFSRIKFFISDRKVEGREVEWWIE
jgi:hypothetical protein